MKKEPVITYLEPEPDSSPEMKLYVKYLCMPKYEHLNANQLWDLVKKVMGDKDEK